MVMNPTEVLATLLPDVAGRLCPALRPQLFATEDGREGLLSPESSSVMQIRITRSCETHSDRLRSESRSGAPRFFTVVTRKFESLDWSDVSRVLGGSWYY